MNARSRLLSTALFIAALNLLWFPANASGQSKDEEFAAKVKDTVAKLGTGSRYLVKVKLKDKTKVSGYISEITDKDFTITFRRTLTNSKIAYNQVREIKAHDPSAKKMSYGKAVLATIGFVIGMGIVFALIYPD